MKTYKLIKEYPGSPELGSIKNEFCFNVNKYSEFWEEVVEKDFEILSFIEEGSDILFRQLSNVISIYGNPAYSCNRKDIITYCQCLNDKCLKIHSIKRLSDGEIFTIGDNVTETITGSCNGWKISEFSLKDTRCFTAGVNMNSIEKIKQPLFTTEDGVDIFVGDTYYWVNTYFELNEEKINHEDDAGAQETAYNVLWNFSTKKAAEEYILMNKPCLSYKEVLEQIPFTDNFIMIKLKETVRTKI